jgi:glutathione S-transferase
VSRAGRRRPRGDATEALARARRHGRAAAAEALAAIEALLDAGALVSAGEPAAAHPLLAPLAQLLAHLKGRLEGAAGADGESVLAAVAEALDAEIARWEERAHQDPEARAVLRAFLGVRELLWEFGVRRPDEPGAPRDERRPAKRRSARVQRVRVQG